jgi:hypothetical protein
MRRVSARSGNKPIAASRMRSVVIAIFAEHSTPLLRRTIIVTSSVRDTVVQENVMKRREFLKLSVGTAAVAALSAGARAQTGVKEIRVGYQKTGVLVIARQQAVLEKRFAARQIGVKWIEFT